MINWFSRRYRRAVWTANNKWHVLWPKNTKTSIAVYTYICIFLTWILVARLWRQIRHEGYTISRNYLVIIEITNLLRRFWRDVFVCKYYLRIILVISSLCTLQFKCFLRFLNWHYYEKSNDKDLKLVRLLIYHFYRFK